MAISAAVVGAVAATGGATVAASQANKQNKEINRQKSIAADNQRLQDIEIQKQKDAADAEAKATQGTLDAKTRADTALANSVSDTVNKRRMRGRRSLISGLETGVDPASVTDRTTLG